MGLIVLTHMHDIKELVNKLENLLCVASRYKSTFILGVDMCDCVINCFNWLLNCCQTETRPSANEVEENQIPQQRNPPSVPQAVDAVNAPASVQPFCGPSLQIPLGRTNSASQESCTSSSSSHQAKQPSFSDAITYRVIVTPAASPLSSQAPITIQSSSTKKDKKEASPITPKSKNRTVIQTINRASHSSALKPRDNEPLTRQKKKEEEILEPVPDQVDKEGSKSPTSSQNRAYLAARTWLL